MNKQTLSGTWQFRQSGSQKWLPATVPGGVHTDLLALGLIPDPFAADNEKKVQWVAESDWEYRRSFRLDKGLAGEEHRTLVCDGLDTLAEVSLNGRLLGKTDNMFRRWSWDVSGILKAGGNEIEIVFRAPVPYIQARQAARPLTGGGDIPGGPYLRKAPCQWGWDWGPKLPPIGIWKDIRLEGYSQAKLADVHIRQIHADGKVTISAETKIEQWEPADLQIILKVTSPDGKVQTVKGEAHQYRRHINLQSAIANHQSSALVAEWLRGTSTLQSGSFLESGEIHSGQPQLPGRAAHPGVAS